ncbi:hypothetical protein [Paracoccus sp. SMMA_5]|uniref:hypothetical protein n=1 Tax=Paracoccus sp. SMMA_5 TaxID=2654281 RepID=UPI0012B2B925|nr:hypothetical protein [Paracoccus sp. SMMA_5]UXU73824.1 hypothetical protein GB879_007710 [Paracoccus sp. SMMA_5]
MPKDTAMPRQRKWRVLRDFEWAPKPNVIMIFLAGEIHAGLTRACRDKAGDRIEEIRD